MKLNAEGGAVGEGAHGPSAHPGAGWQLQSVTQEIFIAHGLHGQAMGIKQSPKFAKVPTLVDLRLH